MNNKYCRICWNTEFWHRPTGDAPNLETGDSYVVQYGFGHEEWLFNFSWLQPGPDNLPGKFRYGFLQPIGKYRTKYIGQTFDAFIYAIAPKGIRTAVAVIKNVYVPDDKEVASAYSYMRKAGWLDEMNDEVGQVGGNRRGLKHGPAGLINVRFRQDDVQFFEPRFIVEKSHKMWNWKRYQPFNWDGMVPSRFLASPARRKDKKKKTEDAVSRAAIAGTTYDPAHNRLQNALDGYLSSRYGESSVSYEEDGVDLVLRTKGREIYFEIKMAFEVKQCIRQALGQLLEYSFYPNRKEASELIIVGENRARELDIEYLGRLQKKFGLPVRYMKWDSALARLEGEL